MIESARKPEMKGNKYMDNIIIKKRQGNVMAVVGGAWGDEGKGKIASKLTQKAHIVARGTGGANAGHTVVFQGNKIPLHLVPSGIVYPEKIAFIGQGVVIDINLLLEEIEQLKERGVPSVEERLKISDRAHIVFPFHKGLDELHETLRKHKIGTTKRGIGPAYADKDYRTGIRMQSLLLPEEELEQLIKEEIVLHNVNLLEYGIEGSTINTKMIAKEYHEYGKKLEPMLVDGDLFISEYCNKGLKIVLEGAQAYRLDKDFGDYPDCTSSNCVTDGALIGAHLNHYDLELVVEVLKAHTSRVGNGSFPTELKAHVEDYKVIEYNEEDAFEGDIIREFAHEYGTTTKRPRRCGWFDCVLVRTSKRANGPDVLCINHLDTLGRIGNKLGYIKMCTAYEYQGKIIKEYPGDLYTTKAIPKPIYKEFKGGWDIDPSIREYDKLPKKAKEFIEAIEKETQIPVGFIGIGPDNEDLISRI